MTRHSLEPSISTKLTIKFLCSYGGKIVPRYPDGKLRYHGGHTRVLAVHRSISFAELKMKMEELCGTTASIKCQLPTEDLDALISIKSDEDLLNLLQEYHQLSLISSTSSIKVRTFLLPIHTSSKSTINESFSINNQTSYKGTITRTSVSSSLSSSSSSSTLSPKSLSPSSSISGAGSSSPRVLFAQHLRPQGTVVAYPAAKCYAMRYASSGKCLNCSNSREFYVVHNGNYLQY